MADAHVCQVADKPGRDAKRRERGGDDTPEPSAFDPLDPATRRAAQLAPLPIVPATVEAVPSMQPAGTEMTRARVSIEELLPQLVKRIAWAGDRRRGSVQMELGAGPHAGTTVTVHSDSGRLRVELQGSGADALRSRIEARLRRHGLDVESVV